ncbi:MAG: FHA domain-containing protein [Azoarcus sp.]|jgi:hypothetical protein|nr:FHA domain-containing protein [Azoarcus sp.]
MPSPPNLCVLVAEIVGGDRLITRLGEAETSRAVERCLNRIDLAIGGSGGEIIARDRAAVIASFEQCDGGVMAACEALDRVRKLPPVSGTQMRVRIGVHYGAVEKAEGEGVEGARLILQACDADQSLSSSLAVAELTPSVRHFASAEAFHDDALGSLPWPVFMIGNQNTTPVSPAESMRPRPEPSSPLTASRAVAPKASATQTAPAQPAPAAQTALNARMRLQHRQDTMFIDENRPIVLIGRELGNDVVIFDPRASRQHARIERRRDGFVLIDQSTNGCFVVIDGQEERCVKDAELFVSGKGHIGCGFSFKEFEDDIVFFEFV